MRGSVIVTLLCLALACLAAPRPFLGRMARNSLIKGVAAPPAFSVNVYDYGAAGDGHTDDTAAFQSALNAAASGGVVVVPSGRFMLNGTLSMPQGTTLQGTFATVPSHDIGMNANDELEGSILMPSGGRGCLDPTQAFLTVNEDCTVRGLVVFYPDVTCGPTPVPYPWTFHLVGNNPSVQDVECLNCWNMINATQAHRHYIARVQGQPLNIGVYVDQNYDIGRIEDVHFNPWFCQDHGFLAYQMVNGRAFVIGRSDWEYVFNTFAFAYAIGYHFIQTAAGACNGNFLGIGADMMTNASIQVDQVQPMGLVVTNAEFTAFCTPVFGLNCSAYNPIEVVVSPTNVGVVRFVNGEFWGPSAQIADIQGSGTVSFSDCSFMQWDRDNQRRYAITGAGTGNLSVRGCSFQQSGSNQILVEGSMSKVMITGNIIQGPTLFDVPSKSKYVVDLNVSD